MFTFLRGSCRIPHVYTHVHMYTHVNQKQYSLNCKHSCLHCYYYKKGDVCMVDDLVILAQFVKLGRLRKKVFMELAQKEISQICKLGEKKGKYCTSSTYHAVYDLIDKGLVEYVDPDSKRRKEVRLTDLGYNVFEKLDIVCW